ncbi:FAD binding domain protein [Aspergillus sclerotialis]|uniref:FAD binding domain protein n=1 Tax=Aspergillus sclerotialis TaxID=2070753 RepID=A0A3A2ZZH3_9EURO|nr:FAD binding domain protein [Aspergillus sclerotialis]
MNTESQRPTLHIVIVGAGIAGLTAAIALGKQGHHVEIIEKSKFAQETGAAVHLPPNCTALLNWMDIDPAQFGGNLLEQMHFYDSHGFLRHKKQFAEIRGKWQAEWYLAHRVDLHNHLKQRAKETATLHTGCKIVSVNIKTGPPSVALDDGRVFVGDILLGADGLRSCIRREIAPASPAPYVVDKSCFRWLLPTSDLKKATATAESVREPGVFVEWAAGDRRLVAYPCSDNRMFNMVAFLPTADAGIPGGGWQATGDKTALVHAFSEFPSGVRALAEQAGDDLKVWELYEMESLPTWVTGHCALLGDAAHPFQPCKSALSAAYEMPTNVVDLGQGAAMAIEDAVSLATLLPRNTKTDDIPARLLLYEKARRPRVEMILGYTRLNGRDENDSSARRVTVTEMVHFMNKCFDHNEIKASSSLLEDSLAEKTLSSLT